MKHISAIQSQLAINKVNIRYLEEEIECRRQAKSYADREGFLSFEYKHHNSLKRLRAELKNYVRIQVALKAILKGQA